MAVASVAMLGAVIHSSHPQFLDSGAMVEPMDAQAVIRTGLTLKQFVNKSWIIRLLIW
jgi:hypothetical protein